jgi:hypothetical protein
MTARMKQIMVQVHRASRDGLQSGRCFEMYGFDFMVDEQLQVHLLEVRSIACSRGAVNAQ